MSTQWLLSNSDGKYHVPLKIFRLWPFKEYIGFLFGPQIYCSLWPFGLVPCGISVSNDVKDYITSATFTKNLPLVEGPNRKLSSLRTRLNTIYSMVVMCNVQHYLLVWAYDDIFYSNDVQRSELAAFICTARGGSKAIAASCHTFTVWTTKFAPSARDLGEYYSLRCVTVPKCEQGDNLFALGEFSMWTLCAG